MLKDKCICLICQLTISTTKKGNLERHFRTTHSKFDIDFPPKTEVRKKQLEKLKLEIDKQQLTFTKPVLKSKAATIASFRISHVLAKNKKSFQTGEIVKQAFLEGADALFENFKNKSEILSAINDLQLSRKTVTRRVESIGQNLVEILKQDIKECVYFSLQFDESTDITDTAQLCIFIRLVFSNFNSKEELLTIIPMKSTTRGVDIYQAFINFVNKSNLPLYKLVCITTDGAPAMIAFSHMKMIKTEFRSTLSDDHLEQCLRLAVNNYSLDYDKLVNDMQCHTSTMARSTK
ncbi:zinc finger BED domain-containing protein 5-like [Aphis craccivora]|uniref:Zinc finger BED domain-containing protein 5-like n=1 Tax=Aphis craccivora TaxID=307492 RepID=A0A6G0YA87_APHCR|nr:zinc finger BED domain-containing protein 5-like [Aphis craccivora]